MKELLNNLHMMLCTELEGMSKKGISTHEDVDIIKDLLSSIKNIYRIEGFMSQNSGMEKSDGYSMRDGSYAMRNSYNDSSYVGPKHYEIFYEPEYRDRRYDHRYSGAAKHEMVEKLKKLKEEASNPEMESAISECIMKMEK